MKVYVGGINGSGKTTIIKKVAEQLRLEYVQLTHLMMDKMGFSGDYDSLRSADDSEKTRIREEILEDLISKDNNFIVDSHYLNLIKSRINPVTGDALAKFDVLVLISAPTEQIFNRIQNESRDRALFSNELSNEEELRELELYQEKTRDEFVRLAKLHSIKNIEIVNVDGKLEASVKELVDFIKQC